MIDTRTFGEIYATLNEVTQYELREKVKKACVCSEPAIRNWRTGHRRPIAIYQKNIVRVLKSFGIEATPDTLFPKRA